MVRLLGTEPATWSPKGKNGERSVVLYRGPVVPRAEVAAVLDAIVAAEERKLGFLFDKMPKADAPSVMTGRQWMPSRFSIGTFAKYVEAANDPAAVLEQAARDDQAKRVGLKPVDPPAKKPGHAGGSTEEK